ncbi:MAG: hypothetical protein RR969_10790 [Thermomonas sp.]
MNTVAANAPPLKVWALSLLVAGLLIALPGMLERMGVLSREADHLHALNLPRLAGIPASTRSVVVVGSSKTYYAIEYDGQFGKRLDALDGKVAFTRITANSPTGPEVAATLDALLATPPTLLLLESDLLLLDRHREKRPTDRDTWSNRLRGHLKLLAPGTLGSFLVEKGDNFGRTYWIPQDKCRAATSAAGLQRYAVTARRWTLASPADRIQHRRLLHALQQAGTRVVMLELPRSPEAEQVVPDLLTQQAGRLRERMLADQGYLAWTPGMLPGSLYCDQGHLNQQGQARYSDWLAGKLLVALADPDV